MILQNADRQTVNNYTVTYDIKFENGDSSMQTVGVAGAYPAHAIVRAYEQAADYAQSTHPGQDRRIVVMLRRADESDHEGRSVELREFMDRLKQDEKEFFYVIREDGYAVRQGRVDAIDRTVDRPQTPVEGDRSLIERREPVTLAFCQ